MKYAIIAFSNRGEVLAKRIRSALPAQHCVTLKRCGTGELAPWTTTNFAANDCLIFVGSMGIAVRAIAPLVASKTSDPAVIVIDELGQNCIATLSGHIGQANRLTKEIAQLVGARPIITTATDINYIFAVDSWATERNLAIINPSRIKDVSVALLENRTVTLTSEFEIDSPLPHGVVFAKNANTPDIAITYHKEHSDALQLIPPVLTLGIGCKKGTSAQAIERLFQHILTASNCHEQAITCVCSIDIKREEPGLVAFCNSHQFTLQTYTAEALAAVTGSISSSSFVKATVGVDNVCERSALLGASPRASLILPKTSCDGVTMALALKPYVINFEDGAF